MRACVHHEYISLRSPIAALHTSVRARFLNSFTHSGGSDSLCVFIRRIEVAVVVLLGSFSGRGLFKDTLVTFFYLISLKLMKSNFKDELAAKLSAGPGFPFGPPRLGVVAPPATVNHSTVASGDTTPASLSPGSPSTSGYGSREGYLGGSAGDSDGIKDSYMEGALLRINLNRQRKHRGRTNQSGTASPAAGAVTSTPLHRISEVDTADSLTGRNNIHSSPQHSPLSFPKPKVLLKSSKSSSEANEEMTVVPHSSKTQSPTASTAGLGAAEFTEPKPLANPYENVFTEERAQEKEDQDILNDPSNTEPKSFQADGEEVTGSRLGSSPSRSSSARSQEEGEKGESEGQESPSHSPTPSPSAMRSSNGVRIRSLGESDDKFLSQKRSNRTVSSPVGFSSQYQLKRINSGGKQQEGSPIAVPPKVEEESEEKGNSGQNKSSSPSVASPSSVVTSEVEESKEKLPVEGFLSVRALSSVGEENTNRHSRVCDLVKVFQQQQSGAT
ncbi:unnamed protein product [Hymenolepis diminuta]|uniref:WD repeat-containing protein 44 n=1 Tax=Hymenolepis diminuta TaxID=6216 RepID=A0A0R3SHM3_HYMDI|nr:unnamed protein product [Hymenolepis diminuta]